MRLGIFAKTFEGADPGSVLSAVSEAGFSVSQYSMACSGFPEMPDAIPENAARAVSEAAATAGVKIVAVSGTYNMIHPDPMVRATGHKRLAVLASAAASLSTRLITLCTGTRDAADQWRGHPGNNEPEAWRDLLAAMETAIRIADQYDIELGIEPELANVVDSAKKARRLLDEIASPRLRIILDPANLFETATADDQRAIVSAAVDLLAGRIAMGHAKDRTSAGAFTAAGKGILDYPHLLSCLKRVGFDGALVAHGLASADAGGVGAFLRQALGDAGIAVSS